MELISLILCALFVALIPAIILTVYHQYVLRRKLKNIPQYGRFPFGVAFELMKLTDYGRMQWLEQRMLDFKNGIFIFFVGMKPFINIYKPEFLEIILPSTVNIEKGFPYHLMESWLGKGLLLSTGKQWNHDRKLIGPTFHFSILDQFAVVISEKAEILTKCLEREIAKNTGKAINIFPFANNVALDIICETAMGVDIHAQEVETEYTTTIHRSSKLIADRFCQPWLWSDWLYNLVPSGRKYNSGLSKIHKFTNEVIRKKKISRQSRNSSVKSENEDDELDMGKRKRKAFLDLLLDENEKAETPLTDDELRAQVDTFMFEGHDTTAVAITWTLFLLGNNLEHQEKVHEELEEVFKDSKIPASVKELSQLKYLDRIIKETLRFYPSVPMVSRKLAEDVKINDYTLPKGAIVVLQIAITHINPEVWPDPKKFDPDRFLPDNSEHRNPYAYIPFSAGPRNCIGQRFALLEEKTILTAILRKWRVKSVKTADAVSYGATLIFRPSEDIYIHFTSKK
ncbi:cytochrome P450 4C1-like [Formica exsecta]|uniref:cytochrome P450 4C1-like n=1 Tax=Formica exsecta TaxID=72781 RepID=UPI001141C6D6|nr:cytochrome P450 4C1-like [Formica exsecta]XP_029660892.1 cytochrome P450 4C1-like [Formica exsecta]XP_029660901.1 cytochrome P450 4C1-like [Formica exsecta]XP_029660909.1 cytochrome P450 4C1-like [Formica exsecta]XP_029660918.1 cytochrome P450 4C1-like [Formica exsecta]XP_029660925.1 cytochrome P450 4C1-like [Formica exsecta]